MILDEISEAPERLCVEADSMQESKELGMALRSCRAHKPSEGRYEHFRPDAKIIVVVTFRSVGPVAQVARAHP